jgi:mono/diheme cytochrome c family protein
MVKLTIGFKAHERASASMNAGSRVRITGATLLGGAPRSRHALKLLPGLLVAAALLGCRDRARTDEAAVEETPQQIYAQHCLGCHGAHGEGAMGSNIQSLNRSIDQIVSVIRHGQGKMPSFQGDLSEKRMRAVAGYIKTFKFSK